MKVFTPEEFPTPRADMFLPGWVMGLGVVLYLAAIGFAILALATMMWYPLIGFALLAILGGAAHLCWKNQSVRILDESRFEYTTFLGKKTVYLFSEIKDLRQNSDSFTLFVGDGKVHIEFAAYVSQRLFDKIREALERNRLYSAMNG